VAALCLVTLSKAAEWRRPIWVAVRVIVSAVWAPGYARERDEQYTITVIAHPATLLGATLLGVSLSGAAADGGGLRHR